METLEEWKEAHKEELAALMMHYGSYKNVDELIVDMLSDVLDIWVEKKMKKG